MQAQSNNPPEEWRPVIADERYLVSNRGRVARLLNPAPSQIGYWAVHIGGRNGRLHHVHRLIAETFLGPQKIGLYVNHLDGDKTNNDPSNLAWVTPSENAKHAFRLGLVTPPPPRYGKANHNTKLNPRIVRKIRALRDRVPQRALARQYGVTQTAIRHAQTRHTWKHVL